MTPHTHRNALLLAFLLVGASLAGCAEDAPDAAPSPAADADAAGEATLASDPAASETNASLGARPHLHDYWDGRERVTVLDEEFTVDAPTAGFWTLFMFYYTHEASSGGAFVELPEGQLVFEGTGRLDVTVTWDDPGITGMRFAYRDAGSGEFKKWVRTPKGEVVSLDVAPEMTDMPHTKRSRWLFVFSADGTPAVAVGTFRVKMEVVRMRDVALFPGHPDHWQGSESLEVLRASGVAKSRPGPQSEVQRWLEPMRAPEDAVPGDKPIPMETRRLVVNVTATSVRPELKVSHLTLHYRTAEDPSFNYDEADGGTVSEDGRTWTFEIPVEMDETDNPYRETSDWSFRVTAAYESPVPGGPPCGDGCHDAELQYDIVATAHRAPEE